MKAYFVAMLALLWITLPAAAQGSREEGSANSAHAKKQFEFEVFSIRPHKAGTDPFNLQLTPDGYRATTDLEFAIKLAYFPEDWRTWSSWKIKNAPAWVTTDWYDVQARVAPEDLAAWQEDQVENPSGNSADSKLLRSAWRAALRERCKLAVRVISGEAPYLDLMVSKHGAKLKDTVPGAVKPVKFKTFRFGKGFYIEGNGERRFVGISMEELAVLLTRLSPDYPVRDKTGFTGRHDFTLPWYDYQHYGDSEFSDPLDRMPLKGTGLTLKRGKGPVYVVNIDRIERPSPN